MSTKKIRCWLDKLKPEERLKAYNEWRIEQELKHQVTKLTFTEWEKMIRTQ